MEIAKGREITNKEMINANELRIGNWANIGHIPHLIIEGKYIDLYSDDYEGIPLTPEVLEKAGFEKVYSYDQVAYWQLNCEDIDIYTGDKNGILEVVFSIEDHEIKRVNHLHILQNLYYSLTGTELTIEL